MKIKETLKKILGFNRPIPLLVVGYDVERWERRGGGDIYVQEFVKKPLFFDGFAIPYIERTEVDEEKKTKTLIWNVIPCGPSHDQDSDSRFGFLITWPFCFSVWFGRRCFRIGLALWDAGAEKYVMPTFKCGERE